ncbi:hypothetical protein V8E54_012764 [Elaphomyces granulatus]
MDKAGEEGRDRVSIVQTWNLFSTGSLEGGATPPARFISNSLPPLSFSVVGTSTVRLPQSQHQGSRYPFDCQRYGFSARRPLSEKVDRQISRGYTAEMAADVVEGVPRSVDMFYQLPGPRSPDAGRMAG